MKREIRKKWIGLVLVGVWVGFGLSSPVHAQESGIKLQQSEKSGKLQQPEKVGKPDLQFKEKVYDFGTVFKGASVTHKFEFTNKGDGVLNIGKVKTSCGCTAALTSSKTVKPGESGSINATFNSKNFRGRITKKIYVSSDDPDEGKIQLVIKGSILEEVTLDPQRLAFNMIKKGAEHIKSFHIKQAGIKLLKIIGIKSNLAFLSAKVESTDKIFDVKSGEKLDYEVQVTVAKDAPIGRFHGMLTITTNIEKQAEIKYQVIGVIQ